MNGSVWEIKRKFNERKFGFGLFLEGKKKWELNTFNLVRRVVLYKSSETSCKSRNSLSI